MFTLSHPQEQPDVFNSHSLLGLAVVTGENFQQSNLEDKGGQTAGAVTFCTTMINPIWS